MNAFEQMEWPVWKTLTDQEKQILMRQVLMYFVSPLTLVRNVTLKDFAIQGIKCRTFEFTIDGEPFVFVPGQKETILGWDQGLEGLSLREIMAGDAAFTFLEGKDKVTLPTVEELNEVVNEFTSPLRKANIPPMIVSKYPIPFGATYIGSLNTVTGSFTGEVGKFSPMEWEIKKQVFPKLSEEEAFLFDYPKVLFKENLYYAALDSLNNVYHVYAHENTTLSLEEKKLRKKNFYLPNEDEYEYLLSAGARRLFFWGNQQNFFNGTRITPEFSVLENMFGLAVPLSKTQQDVIAAKDVVKGGYVDYSARTLIEAILPLSPYYRSKVTLPENLSAEVYTYRKISRIVEPK